MIDDTTGQEPAARPLQSYFDRYLQNKGKGRGSEGGNYHRNAARELDNSEEMVRERYSHIEAGEPGDVATEALEEVD